MDTCESPSRSSVLAPYQYCDSRSASGTRLLANTGRSRATYLSRFTAATGTDSVPCGERYRPGASTRTAGSGSGNCTVRLSVFARLEPFAAGSPTLNATS